MQICYFRWLLHFVVPYRKQRTNRFCCKMFVPMKIAFKSNFIRKQFTVTSSKYRLGNIVQNIFFVFQCLVTIKLKQLCRHVCRYWFSLNNFLLIKVVIRSRIEIKLIETAISFWKIACENIGNSFYCDSPLQCLLDIISEVERTADSKNDFLLFYSIAF